MYKTNHYHINRIIDGELVAVFATIEEVRKYMRMKNKNNYGITFMDENGDTHNCQIEIDGGGTIYDFFKEVCKTYEEFKYLEDEIKSESLEYKYLFWKIFIRPYFARYVDLPTNDIFDVKIRYLSDEEIKNRQALIKRIFRKKFLKMFE